MMTKKDRRIKKISIMKTTILTSLFFAQAVLISAQPTIKNAQDFTAGTIIKYQPCETEGVKPGETGAGQTWDFSNLKKSGPITTEKIILPGKTAYADTFPGANLVEKYSNGPLVFMDKEADANNMVGYADTKSGFLMSYPNPMQFAVRPLAFEMKDEDAFTTAFTTSGYDFEGTGTSTIDADGYGTLILPDKTYKDVLRVKVTQEQTDILKKYKSASERKTVTYVWFDKEHRSALLKISTTESERFNEKTVDWLVSEEVSDE
jgi:hypothetical protein